MNATVIALIIIGLCMFLISFIIMKPKKEDGSVTTDSTGVPEEIINTYQDKIKNAVKQYSEQVIENTNRELTALSNQSMMDISELADQVLEDIKKNHNECTFLYDMIEDKGQQMKTYVSDCTKQLIALQDNIRENSEKVVEDSANRKNKKQVSNRVLDQMEQLTPAQNHEEDMQGTKEIQIRNRKIVSMYQNGMSAIEIAKKLDMGIGEVQVSIDLFQGEEK